MGNVSISTKPENTSDAPEERSEQGQELQDLQPGRLSQNALPNTILTMPLKSALKKNKPWFMVRDEVEKKEVRFNLADLEMRDEDEDPMASPPAPGYGVKFLETEVWPGRDVDQVEVADDTSVLPDSANLPDAANSLEPATSESKD